MTYARPLYIQTLLGGPQYTKPAQPYPTPTPWLWVSVLGWPVTCIPALLLASKCLRDRDQNMLASVTPGQPSLAQCWTPSEGPSQCYPKATLERKMDEAEGLMDSSHPPTTCYFSVFCGFC